MPDLLPGEASYYSTGPRPRLITGAIVAWLRQHFVDAANIETPGLKRGNDALVWKSDPLQTGIVIDSATLFDPRKIEFRPAVYVRGDGLKYQRIAIGNRVQPFVGQHEGSDWINLWTGSHTVFAVAGEPAECDLLAAEVYRELNQFAPVMRCALKLHRLQPASVSPVSILEESTDNYAVAITLEYGFQEHWRLRPQASERLQAVSLELDLQP